MKNFLVFGLLLLFLSSCSKSDDVQTESDGEFIVHNNAEMKINNTENGTYIEIIEGDNLVFEYHFSEKPDPEVADSGYNEYLIFELNKNTGDFDLNNEDFSSVNAHLRRSCFCPHTDYKPISEGSISGKKIGELEWKVKFDVETLIEEDTEFPYTIQLENSGLFRPVE